MAVEGRNQKKLHWLQRKRAMVKMGVIWVRYHHQHCGMAPIWIVWQVLVYSLASSAETVVSSQPGTLLNATEFERGTEVGILALEVDVSMT